MPPSRLERAVIVAGAGVLGLLVWLIVSEWDRFTDREDEPAQAVSTTPSTTASPAAGAKSARRQTLARPTSAGRLTLTATRGDCWLILRSGSASGRELFSGILSASRTISFQGRRFWLSIGAATNVDARFNGKPLRGFPIGTANVAIDGASTRIVP